MDEVKLKLQKHLETKGSFGSNDMAAFTSELAGGEDAPKEEEKKDRSSAFDTDLPNDVVSDEDKAAFLDAVCRNKRYERPFSLYGGRVRGVIRSRLISESTGISATSEWLRLTDATDSPFVNARNMRMAMFRFQLKSLNGVGYEPPAGPYSPVKSAKTGEVVPPAWIAEAEKLFGDMDDGMSDAVHEEIKAFERLYWLMSEKASEPNFWPPAEFSIV